MLVATGEWFGECLFLIGQMCAVVWGACEVCALFSRVIEKDGREAEAGRRCANLTASRGFNLLDHRKPRQEPGLDH